MEITRDSRGLLNVKDPDAIRILFMAPYAPDAPDYQISPYTGDGTYPEYHYQIFRRLERLGFRVDSTSKPYTIVHAGGAVDYVFSLFNRMPIRNSEVFVSAYCEYLDVPYLGAPPNVRAAAEDKYITKLIADSVGIPVPRGVPFHRGITPLADAPFPGPYFVKDRFGAASERISMDSVQSDWSGARRMIEWLWDEGTDALVEEYSDGIDITVPVIGDEAPRPLGVFEPVSDKPGNILTHDLKLTDHLGYRELDLGDDWVRQDVLRLWSSLGAIDYFRLDYRFDPVTGQRRFLEMNVCCYIGEHGPFGLAAARDQMSTDALLGHVVAYSLHRQLGRREKRERIL
jgi:D-alanine-D-alanine ligase